MDSDLPNTSQMSNLAYFYGTRAVDKAHYKLTYVALPYTVMDIRLHTVTKQTL